MDPEEKPRKPFPVTDPDDDAPDGAVIDGYVRVGGTGFPLADRDVQGYVDWDDAPS